MLDWTVDDERYAQRLKHMADEQYYRQMREAALLLQAGDGKNAAVILTRLHELYPDNVDVASNLGAAYILSKRYSAAIPILEAATKIEENNAGLWVNLAAAYLGTLPISTLEQQDRAIGAFRRALEIDPAHPNVHYNLGLIYEDRRDWANACQMFRQALQTNPADKDARMLLAKAEKRLNEECS
jgi:tetratricopeptide (TPR) repeat protein